MRNEEEKQLLKNNSSHNSFAVEEGRQKGMIAKIVLECTYSLYQPNFSLFLHLPKNQYKK